MPPKWRFFKLCSSAGHTVEHRYWKLCIQDSLDLTEKRFLLFIFISYFPLFSGFKLSRNASKKTVFNLCSSWRPHRPTCRPQILHTKSSIHLLKTGFLFFSKLNFIPLLGGLNCYELPPKMAVFNLCLPCRLRR